MPESSDLLQRYSAPTCTLEVVGEPSALSRWTAEPVLKGVRFRLSIQSLAAEPDADDQDAESQDTILLRGDRRQLESLIAAVQTYVQGQLVASGGPSNQTEATRGPESGASRQRLSLQPQGLTRHRLQAEGLMGDRVEQTIVLTSLQLADLATVVDSFDTNAIALLVFASPQQRRQRWWTGRTSVGSAAAVVIMAVGVATVLPRVLNDSSPTSGSNIPAPISDGDQSRQVTPPATADSSESDSPTNGEESATDQSETGALPESDGLSANNTLPGDITTPGTTATPATPKESTSNTQRSSSATHGQRDNPSPRQPTNPSTPTPSSRSPYPESATAAQSRPPLPDNSSPSVASSPAPSNVPSPVNPAAAELSDSVLGTASENADAAGASTALEAVPMARLPQSQIDEVQQFFADRWRPQPDLSDSLVYEVQLNPDGTLARITPMSRTAILEGDRIALPEPGRAIASASAANAEILLRLELKPNGQVVVEN
ncbi:MAG: DUF4335 domain-containing protein [Cyanobacteria bacterium J06639_16]